MDAHNNSSCGQILTEEQEAETHLVSWLYSMGLWGDLRAAPSTYREGTEEPEPGSAWWCRAGGQGNGHKVKYERFGWESGEAFSP